jgi:putative adenylate-forming enzyme
MNTLTLLQMFAVLAQFRRHDGWTRQQIEAYQQRQLSKIRAYAYQHSPFYRRFHQGLHDKPLCELPVLTKPMLMSEFDGLVTDRAIHLDEARQCVGEKAESPYLGRYWVNSTSGSGGVPGVFLFSKREWVTVMASYARGQLWGGVGISPLRSHKFAFILSPTPHHMSYRVSKTMRSPWARMLHLSATEPIHSIVSQLNSWQPQILGAYASMARLLAAEQLAHCLRIQPQRVFVSAEVLTPEVRRLIEQAWGDVVFNEYAATETAVIAAECEQHNGLHIYDDLLFVENVDEQNRPVPAGTFGAKLLVTVLFNRTQPLIRYELNDSVRLSDTPCGCGRPYTRIEYIQGRQEEVLCLPALDGRPIPIHFIVFHQIMDCASIGGWQVILRHDGLHILLAGVNRDTDSNSLEKTLRQTLERQGVQVPTICIEQVEAIPRAASGKTPAIRSEIG